jgi:hypothetical protein
MPSDDIRDLLGRYATEPLTSEERERLFEAALSDQVLFEQLAREQELKLLLQEPGARDRIMRALDVPDRRSAWILSFAVAAASVVVAIGFLIRSPARPPELAKITRPDAQTEIAAPAPQPSTAPVPIKAKPKERPVLDQPSKPAAMQETLAKQQTTDALTPAPAAPPGPVMAPKAQQFSPQNAVGGPRQMASQAHSANSAAPLEQRASFGFSYSLGTKGHLVIVPAADGYLFVQSDDGAVLYNRKQIAAAITTDVVIGDAVRSVTITFSAVPGDVAAKAAARDASSGTVEGTSPLVVEIKVPRR